MSKNFAETGYIVLRKAINKNLVNEIKSEIYSFLKIKDKTEKKKFQRFCKIVENIKIKEFDFTEPIFETLLYRGLIKKFFLEKKFINTVAHLLGRDLAFCSDGGITLNLPKKASSKKNYLFKDWHQEIWSGASPSTVQIWSPLIFEDINSGQMEIMEGSHKWGHIPHMGRKPTKLPKKYKTKKLNLDYGDVIIFSTLLMHRSLPTKKPRLSLPVLIKNFKDRNHVFQDNRSFKIYSYSEITKLERILGNEILSPYRLKNIDEESKNIFEPKDII